MTTTDVNEQGSDEIRAALDAFPNVLKRAQSLWGTKECDLFLQSLFMDTRGGTRRGFPMDAAEEIMFLVKFNKYVRAMPLAQQLNVPVAEAFRIVDKADQAQLADSPWNDPGSSNDASARQRPTTREPIKYQVKSTPTPRKSGALAWILELLLLAVAGYLLLPILKGGAG